MAVLVLLALPALLAEVPAEAGPRLQQIQKKGQLTCGVLPGVAGFAKVAADGTYSGLDVDICRALSAAIFGVPDKVRYVEAASVNAFLRTADIDVVSRRLTWSLQREQPLGLLFGPVTFYDGQSFLVPVKDAVKGPLKNPLKNPVKRVQQLSGIPICVLPGTLRESNLSAYFRSKKLALREVFLDDEKDVEEALTAGRCSAYSADASMLASIRSRMSRPGEFDILADYISKEPLAQLVRQDDPQFFDILRWTVFALINAEELGITSANVDVMLKSEDADVQQLLGIIPGSGKGLGLSERWAFNVIKALGNYGEIFERNVGRRSPLKLDRGLNRLWTAGGLMYAPPLR